MKKNKYEKSGTVAGGIVVLIIVGLVVLTIVRVFWLNAANDYYDSLTSVYISQTKDYEAGDQDKLKKKLLEDGMFIKMHKWDKEDFIKDKEFYKELINTYEYWQRNKREKGSVMEDLINL
ncbi:MAG: hypothetical protein ACYS1A_00675 [Planctomycetota bacterium]|jgi:hypothetical protein